MRNRRRRRRKKRESSLSPAIPKMFSELIDLDKVRFTTHALERFIERAREIHPPRNPIKDPETTVRKILSHAHEDYSINKLGRVKRLIDNDFVDVLYFIHDGWRFVLKPEDNLFFVLTIERVT